MRTAVVHQMSCGQVIDYCANCPNSCPLILGTAVATRAGMNTSHIALLVALIAPLAGCAQALEPPEGWQQLDTEPADGWQQLVGGEVTIEAQSAASYCVFETLRQDVFVSSFAAVAAWKDHYLSLSVGPALEPFSGGPSELVFESRADLAPLQMPANVAVKLEAGQQLRLFVRAVNASAQSSHSHAAVRVTTLEAADASSLAEAVVVGPPQLTIPTGVSETTGHCKLLQDSFLFGVTPHVQPAGESLFAVAHSSFSGDVILYDDRGDDHSAHTLAQPVPMRAGEEVEVSCGHQNDSKHGLQLDPGDLERHCFATVYYFPAAPEASFRCDK